MGDGEPSSVSQLHAAPAQSDDRAVMERVHAGDRSALQELLRRYWRPLVSYAERLVHSRDAAEDVVQEVVLGIWSRRAAWAPSDHLRSYLYRATRNRALNERRDLLTRLRYQARSFSGSPAQSESPEQASERTEIHEAIARALESLPLRRREIFVLARYHGHTYREIADILDISPQTVANQMSAALAELRRLLRPHLDDLHSHSHLRLVRNGDPAEP